MRIDGKQIRDNSIKQEQLNLVDPILDKDAATKIYVDDNNSIEYLTPSNKNMYAMDTVDVSYPALACVTPVTGVPLTDSKVSVSVNSVSVSVGVGKGCYFSSDGGVTQKTDSNVEINDLLYWVSGNTGYNLEADDKISFIYLTSETDKKDDNDYYQILTDQSTQEIDTELNFNAVCPVQLLDNTSILLSNLSGSSNGIIDFDEQTTSKIITIVAIDKNDDSIPVYTQNAESIITNSGLKLSIGWEYNGFWVNLNYNIYG